MWNVFSLISRQNEYPTGRFSFKKSDLCETFPVIGQISGSIDVRKIIDTSVFRYIEDCMSDYRDDNMFQWNQK